MAKRGRRREKRSITLDPELLIEIEDYLGERKIEAIRKKEKEPALSNILEELLRIGWETTKKRMK